MEEGKGYARAQQRAGAASKRLFASCANAQGSVRTHRGRKRGVFTRTSGVYAVTRGVVQGCVCAQRLCARTIFFLKEQGKCAGARMVCGRTEGKTDVYTRIGHARAVNRGSV